MMHSTYLDNNEIFFIVYPPCIGQCVPQFNETFIELRYALVNAWGVDMLIFIVYPPRIGQCVPQFAVI